ncbi:MAG TPA: FlgD immunoglobulin-like domain containing protein, partial [Candidatus Krumholzibacterium sp.]|nr:FlgD immunoglobulin-like domain containing protein [Candidatus Krumholzibacterium sp.]
GVGGTLASIHNFNNDTREEFGTDWVFTVFVADQSAHYDPNPILPDAGCWGGAGYTLNSFQGGPYMAIPYPACRYGTGGPFSNLFAVGMFRIFWGQYESDASAAHCEPEHGYLSVPNLNSIHVYLGQTEPCGYGADCVMHTFAFDTYFPVCEYTLGQVGLGDDNQNSVPDVYEVYPELEVIYVPGFNSDTTYDGSYLVSARATNEAVPNRNPAQIPLLRIDYAPTIVKGWVQINTDLQVDILPGDRVWDESREDMSYILTEGLEPGMNLLNLKVENSVGLRDEALLEVTYIGMKFFDTGIDSRPEGIVVDWKTSDLIFGADFELMRRDLSTDGPRELVAVIDGEDFVESGARRRVYRYTDGTVAQGHLYSYSVVSRFETLRDGVLEEFVDESPEMTGRAMVSLAGRMVSSILPNPMGPGCCEVVFTMDIPCSYWSPSGSRAGGGEGIYYAPSDVEIKTDVKVSIFDVKGQLVLDIFELPVYGGLITRTWDGRDRRGVKVSPGVYFLRVTAADRQEVRKIVVLR